MSTEQNPTIDQKLDKLMEAILLQQQLLQQVLLSYDKLLQKLIVVQKPQPLLSTPNKEIITWLKD